MHVISEGREAIVKVWSPPAQQDGPYRLMQYLIQEKCDAGVLVLNTVTGEMVLLEEEDQALIDELPCPYKEEMVDLIAHHIIVPDGYDEYNSVNQLRKILLNFARTTDITGYSILVTSFCNARCFYCFEDGYPRHHMSRETADKVIDYIASHCNSEKRVFIQWFGGEPTLGEDRIDQICDGLLEKGIQYATYTISNAYLFTKDMAKKAREKWHLQNIQITMDGTEEIYNKTKAYINPKESPYRRVLNNIGYLLDEGIRVILRMNLDFHNINDLKILIDELAERFSGRPNFSAYVHELFEDEGSNPVSHVQEERDQLMDSVFSLNRYIEEKGCRRARKNLKDGGLPSLQTVFCMADNPSVLLINPIGQIGKCDHFSFELLVGNLSDGYDRTSQNADYWLNHSYASFCKICSLFPVCGKSDNCIAVKDCRPNQKGEKINGIRKQMLLCYNSSQEKKKEASYHEETGDRDHSFESGRC